MIWERQKKNAAVRTGTSHSGGTNPGIRIRLQEYTTRRARLSTEVFCMNELKDLRVLSGIPAPVITPKKKGKK